MVSTDVKSTNQKVSNRSKILHTITDKKIARKDLAKLVDLTPAAITILTKDMIQQGIIEETSEQAITKNVGRKKTFIRINKDYKYIIGVAIETDSLTISISNMYKEILKSVQHKYSSPSWNDVKNLIHTEVTSLMDSLKLSKKDILGVGVGIVGKVDSIKGVSLQAIGLWNYEINIVKELHDLLGFPIVVDNNVRILALAEMEQRDYNNNLVFIKYGPGIGASMILNGEIYSGTNFEALEFGHAIVHPKGKQCYCGQVGCLETIGSYISIKETLKSNYEKTVTLKELTENNKSNINTSSILKAYHSEDTFVVTTVNDSLEKFSLALYNLMKILDIKEFILSGAFFKDSHVFSHLKDLIDSYGNKYSMRLKQSVLQNNKSIGGISLARKELFLDTGANEGSNK